MQETLRRGGVETIFGVSGESGQERKSAVGEDGAVLQVPGPALPKDCNCKSCQILIHLRKELMPYLAASDSQKKVC